MANAEGTIRVLLNVTPRESVKQESGKRSTTWTDVEIASTLCPPANAQYVTQIVDYEDTGTIHDGYLNKSKFYAEVTNATTPLATVTGLTHVEFIYIKHTGYQFDSSTTLSSTTNVADNILVRIGTNTGRIIACIPPSGAIALPIQSAAGWTGGGATADFVDSGDFFFKSINPDSLANGANGIAMETIIMGTP